MDENLGDLALFVRVVDAGGFTAATRLTKTPQPTISRRIAQLEERIGLQLLQRSTRSVSMTESGRRVYDHAVLMIASGEAAAAAAQAMRTEVEGLIRLTAPVVLGRAFVAPIIRDLMIDHPKLVFDVEWTTRSVDLLHDNVDVAVGIGRPSDPDVILVRLGNASRRVFAPPGWAGADPRHPSCLDGLPMVALGRTTDALPLALERNAERISVRPDWKMAANDSDLVLDVAKARNLLALLPDFLPPADWRLLLPQWDTRVEINAVTTVGRMSLPKIRTLLDRLKAQADAVYGGALRSQPDLSQSADRLIV